MKLKLLQLNINADNYIPALSKFLEKNSFDILNFQEVTGKNTISGNINSKIDTFEKLKAILGGDYISQLAIAEKFTSDPINSYLGNATFFRKEFKFLSKSILTLKNNTTPFDSNATNFQEEGSNVLILNLEINNQKFYVLNAHLAWGGTDIENDSLRDQNLKLVNFVSHLSHPFILSGDFNISTNQPSILDLNRYAVNLTSKYKITNTLNSRTHRVKKLFPKGLAVDYIYLGNGLKDQDFKVLDNLDLSDHLALTADVEI